MSAFNLCTTGQFMYTLAAILIAHILQHHHRAAYGGRLWGHRSASVRRQKRWAPTSAPKNQPAAAPAGHRTLPRQLVFIFDFPPS
jgi:hypothetical protein